MKSSSRNNRQKIQVRWPMSPATNFHDGVSAAELAGGSRGNSHIAPKPMLMALHDDRRYDVAALIFGTPSVTSIAQVMATGAFEASQAPAIAAKHHATMRAWGALVTATDRIKKCSLYGRGAAPRLFLAGEVVECHRPR